MSVSRSNVVLLHPSRGIAWAAYGLVSLYISMGAWLAFTGPHPLGHADRVGLATLAAMLMLLPVSLFVRAYVLYVRADDDGLLWRTLRETRHVAWSEVSDYYLKSYQVKRSQHERLIVETMRGIITINGDWQGGKEVFRAHVQEHARLARASSWELLGNRPELDWPRTFAYSAKDLRTQKIVRAVAIAAGPLFTALMASERILRMQREGVGPDALYTYLPLALSGLLLCGLFGLMAIQFSAQVRDRQRRQSETLTVDADGLHFADRLDDTRDRFLPWGEIRRCCFVPAPGKSRLTTYVAAVQSENASINFSVALQDYALLQKIIPCHAPNVIDKEWRVVEPPLRPRDAAAQWTSGIVGVGGRRYSYRTSTLRSLAILASFMASVTCLAPLLRAFSLDEDFRAAMQANTFPALIAAALIAYLWWRYDAGGIVLRADGITERTPLGERTLRWGDIVTYRRAGDDAFVFGVVRDRRGKRIRFYLGIDDVDELTREITARAPQAKGSWTKDKS